MSRSWNKVYAAAIFPDAAWFCEQPRFGRGAGAVVRRINPRTGGLDPVAAWRELLAGQSASRVDAVFASRWFRFGLLPWSLQSGRDDDDRRAALVLLDGVDAARGAGDVSVSRVALAPARYGKSRCFAVADAAMASAFAADPGLAPRCWQPWALAALAASAPGAAQGLVAVIEAGHATLLSCEQGWPEQVTVKRWPAEDTSALVGLLQTEQVRRDARVQVVEAAAPAFVRKALAAAGLVSRPLLQDRFGFGLAGERA